MAGENKYLSQLSENAVDNGPAVTTSDVSDPALYMSPQEVAAYNEYQQMQQNAPNTGVLPVTSYYPDVNNNVAVGNSSGSIIGSQTLFAPGGGLVPLGMMDARDAAVQHAALKKAKEVEDFRNHYSKPPTSKLTNINQGLTDEYFKFHSDSWNNALKKAGGDPNKATYLLKNNPNFLAKDQSYRNLALQGDAYSDKLAHIETRMDQGDLLTPAEKASMSRVKRVANPNDPEFGKLGQEVMNLDAQEEFSKSLKQLLSPAVNEVLGTDKDWSTETDYKTFKHTVENLPASAREAVREGLDKIYGDDNTLYPKAWRDKQLDGYTNWKKDTEDLTVHAKPENNEPGLLPSNTNEVNKVNGKVIQTLGSSKPVMEDGKQKLDADGKPMIEKQDPTFRDATFSIHDQATFTKPVKTVIALSSLGTDLTKGLPESKSRNVEVEIGSVGNALVYKGLTGDLEKYNDTMVDDNAPLSEKAKTKTAYETVVPIKYEYVDDEGNKQTGSVWQPLKTVENALRGKKGQNDKALQKIKAKAMRKKTEAYAKDKNKDRVATPEPKKEEKKDWSKYKRK